MDPRFLNYYNRELQHIREGASEFAQDYPKIAGRLGLDSFECADPYVERLLEGFAYMAARVQLKVDSEFSRFTRHLLETTYPGYLCPTPSMTVAEFAPDYTKGDLQGGVTVKKNAKMTSKTGTDSNTACEFRTGSDTILWPVEVTEVEFLSNTSMIEKSGVKPAQKSRTAIRIRISTRNEIPVNSLNISSLRFHVSGRDEQPYKLYEYILGTAVRVSLVGEVDNDRRQSVGDLSPVLSSYGFDDEHALLPADHRVFSGHRLVQEYFAFPQRFLFFDVCQLDSGIRRCGTGHFDLIIESDSAQHDISSFIGPDNLKLFCVPAINLFKKRADRIHLKSTQYEYHVLVDRTRPMDFEVYSIRSVTGHGAQRHQEREYLPLYASRSESASGGEKGFYTLMKEPRILSSRQRKVGPRSGYVGSETFISLVDREEVPASPDLKQLSMEVLCTNRDLPLHMPTGRGDTDLNLDTGAPVSGIRCLGGPSKPLASRAHKDTAWRLVSHLKPNYLSILDEEDGEVAAGALRELLMLYIEPGNAGQTTQIEGITRVTSEAVKTSVMSEGKICIVRGIQITVEVDESAFEGAGVFLFGQVLSRFFANTVSVNSFAETIIRTIQRGEVMRWKPNPGLRQLI